MDTVIDNRVIRDGKVALQHRTTNPVSVEVEGTGRVYSFVAQNNVSLAWVEEQDVERLLLVRTKACNCGNGSSAQKFILASQLNVCLWETGTRCKE